MYKMKTTKKYLCLMLLALVSITFSACSNDDDAKTTTPTTKQDEVIIGDSVVYTAEEMCEKLFGPDGGNADDEKSELRELFMKKIHEKEDSLATALGANGLALAFISWPYYYWSKDQHGKDILLSSVVSWAQYWFFGWHDLDPNNIYLAEHYTIFSNEECPTNGCLLEQITLGDNLLIMPDYIGYGSTKERLHPYLNHEVCALNSVNALEKGYEVFQLKKQSGTKMEDDWKTYVIGCSQGGGNALAVHKYFDTNPEIGYKWRFDYSYCCAGPFSPRKTMDYYYQTKSLSYPVIIPIVIKSMLDCYPEILGKWKEEDFYSKKYLKIKDKIDNLITKKETKSDGIIKKMKEYMNLDDISVNDLLSDSALNRSSEMTQALYKCLDKNDLTTGWTPSHMIKLYHSKEDDVVPYSNSEAVVNAFGDKVSLFRSYVAGHKATCVKWYTTLATNNW